MRQKIYIDGRGFSISTSDLVPVLHTGFFSLICKTISGFKAQWANSFCFRAPAGFCKGFSLQWPLSCCVSHVLLCHYFKAQHAPLFEIFEHSAWWILLLLCFFFWKNGNLSRSMDFWAGWFQIAVFVVRNSVCISSIWCQGALGTHFCEINASQLHM